MTDEAYTKHYYIEGERVCSKIGGGFDDARRTPCCSPVSPISGRYDAIAANLWSMLQRGAGCVGYSDSNIMIDGYLSPACRLVSPQEPSRYFYHSDHLGSSSFITDASGTAIQHLQYLPFGENFVDQHTGVWNTPYKFSGKEKDDETGYSYFGARYYDSDLSVWLSVDPMAGKYPGLSPYAYCEYNPVGVIDPNGLSTVEPYWKDKISNKIVYTNHDSPPTKTSGDWEYIGETFTSVDENGSTDYHAQDGKSYNSVPLEETKISYEAQLKEEYPNTYIFYHDSKNYGPNYSPDYVGVSINGSLISGGGYSGSITFGIIKNDGAYIFLSGGAGTGFDISFGISLSAGDYSGYGKPTANSFKGLSSYQNFGSAINLSMTQDISLKDHKLRIGQNWQAGSVNFSLGSKTIWGGSFGTSYTSKAKKIW